MAVWGPAVAEELRRDVRFALTFKVGKSRRPLTDTERDRVEGAAMGRICVSRGRTGAGRVRLCLHSNGPAPYGRVTWQSKSDGASSSRCWAARRRRGRSWPGRSRRGCRSSGFCWSRADQFAQQLQPLRRKGGRDEGCTSGREVGPLALRCPARCGGGRRCKSRKAPPREATRCGARHSAPPERFRPGREGYTLGRNIGVLTWHEG